MKLFTRQSAHDRSLAAELGATKARLARTEADLAAACARAEKETGDLNTELEQTAIATKAMHDRAQTTIGTLRAEKVGLYERARKAEQALEKAQAEIKRLYAADRVLTPAQREDAADDAAWKRSQDGAGER